MLPENVLMEIRQVVLEMIREGCCNSAGGASCGVTCEGLSVRLGWGMIYGTIRSSDGAVIDDDHAWLKAPDGTVVDPTIAQFTPRIAAWPGYEDIAVIQQGHPMYSQYGDLPCVLRTSNSFSM